VELVAGEVDGLDLIVGDADLVGVGGVVESCVDL